MISIKGKIVSVVLLALLIPALPLRADSSADKVFTIAEKNFETPEECIRYFADRLSVNDLAGCFAACAINETDRVDFIRYTKYLNAIVASTPLPGSTPMFMQMNSIMKMSQIAFQMKIMIYRMCSNLPVVDQVVSSPSDDDLSLFVSNTNARNLAGLKVEKIRLSVSAEILNSERARTNAVRQAAVYGADDSTERVVLYKLRDRWFKGGIRLLKYGKYWKIDSLLSSYSGIPAGGMAVSGPEAFDSEYSE
jgi:hypothetical protein